MVSSLIDARENISIFNLFSDWITSNRRMCKAGFGQEQTKGMCDTPGAALISEPEIKYDHRRSQKLYMPRNNERVTQSSLNMLQSWRANCDLQIIVYNCDPKRPDLSEIARVTDYVVGYSTKGGTTLKEEREQVAKLILAASDETGDKADVKRICKRIMNKAASKRLISKQECMVLLGQLELSTCSEILTTINVNNSKSLKLSRENDKKDLSFPSKYKSRPTHMSHMSLYDYYMATKNSPEQLKHSSRRGRLNIPNFMGYSSTPSYPVTVGYARHTIIVYTPWTTYPTDVDWVGEFEKLVKNPLCPKVVKMQYERVMRRHFDKMTHAEPKTAHVDHSKNDLSPEDYALMMLLGLNEDGTKADVSDVSAFDRGEDFIWDAEPKVSL